MEIYAENRFLISKPDEWRTSNIKSHEPRSVRKRKLINGDDPTVVLCKICNQNILDPKTKSFQGLADGILEEEAALTDDRLQLYSDGGLIPEIDMKPLHKVTHFTVFDGEGHLCPFDTGLIESDELIFFSGYIKPIYDDDPNPQNGVPAQELGPIVEWWISGYDGGNSFLIAFKSPCAEYILMEPSPEYSPFMRVPKQKALLAKIVIEFLSMSNKPTYDELMSRIMEVSVPEDIEPFDSESLRQHAQFIIDQVREVDENKKLISTPAVQDIIKRFKIKNRKDVVAKKKLEFKRIFKATTTTALVRKHFKFFFDGEETPETPQKCKSENGAPTKKISKFSWSEDSNFAVVNDEVISLKDFILVFANSSEKENRIFRVERFFQHNFTKQVHCSEFARGRETILGNAGDPFEIFFLNECSDWPICKIMKKVKVEIKALPKNWEAFLKYESRCGENEFFVRKKYSQAHGSFEDFYDEDSQCSVCSAKSEMDETTAVFPVAGDNSELGIMKYEKIIRGNEEYFPGCCVLLEPFTVVFNAQKSSHRIEKTLITVKADEVIYPEIYRKAKETNLMEECPEPFVVAFVKKIFSRNEGLKKNIYLIVNKFYRPENTRLMEPGDMRLLDLRQLYWSEEEVEVSFEHVRGRCEVVFSKEPPPVDLHTRFYYHSGFDAEKETFYEAEDVVDNGIQKTFATLKKLKTLNAFSGCGGLAEGLRQSGIADFLWAVEIDKSTSEAYKMNFPNVVMFEKDCNLFLKEVLYGKSEDENGNRYPAKGEVEFLCGGPPCQGFSTMNRFTSKEESQYNNSLILTYLSFCDYYRPKFFLMENVRNFVSYKKSAFLKHVLGCLVAMGYQCSFGVLQGGNYGLPQSRRRLFILACAPGYQLPFFPKPKNVFYGSPKNIENEVGGLNYSCRFSKLISGSAPLRSVTIRDAIFDLPSICKKSKRKIENKRCTYFEQFLMGSPSLVCDHVSKEMNPINEARIKHIPAAKGCDWRDLPNIRVRLRDGSLTNLLEYSHHDVKNGKSSCGLLRGVCSCASGKPCDSKSRQTNTLIPWFLVHTANKNNNWTGLYGRLDWDGIFNTVTTNPEPSNQQGKVLHPDEDRTVSVRECARAQGMPDSFKFCGTVADKFRQVGNAVPPPVARAIGWEIRRSLLVGPRT